MEEVNQSTDLYEIYCDQETEAILVNYDNIPEDQTLEIIIESINKATDLAKITEVKGMIFEVAGFIDNIYEDVTKHINRNILSTSQKQPKIALILSQEFIAKLSLDSFLNGGKVNNNNHLKYFVHEYEAMSWLDGEEVSNNEILFVEKDMKFVP